MEQHSQSTVCLETKCVVSRFSQLTRSRHYWQPAGVGELIYIYIIYMEVTRGRVIQTRGSPFTLFFITPAVLRLLLRFGFGFWFLVRVVVLVLAVVINSIRKRCRRYCISRTSSFLKYYYIVVHLSLPLPLSAKCKLYLIFNKAREWKAQEFLLLSTN